MTETNRELGLDDRLLIQDVLLRYARGVDRLDLELVRSCFRSEATCHYGDFFVGPRDGFIDWLPDALTACISTTYHYGNTFIETQSHDIRSELYCLAFHRQRDAQDRDVALLLGVRYLDSWLRTPEGGWAIADRRVVFDWSRIDPVADQLPP